jgi:predicted transcriptional regulator
VVNLDQPNSILLFGLVVIIATAGLSFFYTVFLIWATLLNKRIFLGDRPSFPDYFPTDFAKHSRAAQVLIELLEAEPGFHPVRRRHAEVAEVTQARIARWLNTNADMISNTVHFLAQSDVGYVEIESHTNPRRNIIHLTEKGRAAAIWLEENFAPSISAYLKKEYPNVFLVRFLKWAFPDDERKATNTQTTHPPPSGEQPAGQESTRE